jgi:uncharacterized membrane protein YbhN (UPF0104 family)
MAPTDYFLGAAFGGPEWLRWVMLAVIVLGLALGSVFFNVRAAHDPSIYSPKIAWIRAWIYYCFVILLGWVTGVLGYILERPLIAAGRTDDALWWSVVGVCWLIAIWGYVYWWPRGTITHGRKLHLLPALIHGSMWGLSAGLLYLSFYAMIEQFGFPAIVNGIALVLVVAVYSMNYQLGWWDVFVSPPHNQRATNNGKVAFAHQPFMLATLTLLIMYGDAGLFAVLTIFVMTCSAIAMRFPSFRDSDGPVVSRDTAVGE